VSEIGREYSHSRTHILNTVREVEGGRNMLMFLETREKERPRNRKTSRERESVCERVI
jgi:hypothetical protein